MKRTRILIADPIRIFRMGVCDLLTRESDLEVVHAAHLEEFETLGDQPDIALIDLNLPSLGAIAAVEWLKTRCDVHMIVWSFAPTGETVLSAIRAGADGYLNKEISRAELLRSLRGVVRGEPPLSPDLASLMIGALHGVEERARLLERIEVLSEREREVLDYLARGARNRQVAHALAISEYTVKRHVQNILGKLEVGSRGAAAAFYREAVDRSDLPLAVAS